MSKIILKNIFKSYGDMQVLRHFNLEIAEGEHIVIMGKSGRGKTTLLNIIMGFEMPDFGEIEGDTGSISAIFQEDRLSPDFSALSNVCMSGSGKAEASNILQKLGIDDIKKPAGQMSGGQKRRVALARALAVNAELYIFDEPLKGLDDVTKETALSVIREYTEGKSALFVTHDAAEVEGYADRIIEMK